MELEGNFNCAHRLKSGCTDVFENTYCLTRDLILSAQPIYFSFKILPVCAPVI